MPSLVGRTQTLLSGGGKAAATRVMMATTSTPTPTTAAGTMPPGFTARVGRLDTFCLPAKITGSVFDRSMARAMIAAWRRDGIFQVAMSPEQQRIYHNANAASRHFFQRSAAADKRACVDAHSYSGYIASGEEITDGVADYSEIFTVTKDLPADDRRVVSKWPCHGPCPWPSAEMKTHMTAYMDDLSRSGDELLSLVELGLNVPEGSLKRYTEDGWHHMRVLRFPHRDRTNGKGKKGRGIGSHTDYGLLVMAAQDDVGGLFVRPPHQGEHFANWEKSAAGLRENDSGWVYVPPVPGVFTVFPGDMMQYMTNSHLKSTPHKVGLNTRERFAFAYFHEPNFSSVLKPLPGYEGRSKQSAAEDGIHYGTHFTNMFLRNYPDRITTKKLQQEDRCRMLAQPQLRQTTTTTTPSATSGGGGSGDSSRPNGPPPGVVAAGAEAESGGMQRGGYPAVSSVELPAA